MQEGTHVRLREQHVGGHSTGQEVGARKGSVVRLGKYFKQLDAPFSAQGSEAQWPRVLTLELDCCSGSNPSLPLTSCGSLWLLIIIVRWV